MARNYRDGPKWIVGLVVERKGPLSYVVQQYKCMTGAGVGGMSDSPA